MSRAMHALALVLLVLIQGAVLGLAAGRVGYATAGHAAHLPFRPPYVIAHRGASGELPEHTLPAYRRAIHQEAHFIECDVVLTRDLQPICRHEPNLLATTDAAVRFPDRRRNETIDGEVVDGIFAADLTLAEVKTLRAVQRWPFRDQSHNGRYQVVTLEEFLDVAQSAGRTVGIYPEAKHPTWHNRLPALAKAGLRMEDILLAALHRRGYSGPVGSSAWEARPVFIQCFEPTSLKYMSERTAVPLVLLLGGWPGYVTPDTGVSHEELVSDISLKQLATYISGAGPWKDSLLAPAGNKPTAGTWSAPASSGLAERLLSHGLQVHPYTLRDESRFVLQPFGGNPQAEMRFLMEHLQLHGAFSDFPGTLHAFISGNATHQHQFEPLRVLT